jgi:flagellar basal body-associated protein FliL
VLGNPLFDKIILFFNFLVVLGSAGLVYYSHNILAPPPITNESENKKFLRDIQSLEAISTINMPKLTINLYSRTTRLRYLDVLASVEPYDEFQAEQIKKNQSLIMNEIIEVASFMTPKELGSVSGKIILAERIKKRINSNFREKLVKKIFFPKYVIQ